MYDFDTVINRRNTDSSKWNVAEDELPMWVADMDFETAPEIKEALFARVKHGVFGYSDVSAEWYDAYAGWWFKRHGTTLLRDALIFCTGVIPAISSTVRKLTTPNEKVIIQTPVYNIFFNCIENNGCRVLENPLLYDGEKYRMDFEGLERCMADPQATLMILCNPHNPVGRIWDRDTLEKVGALASKHHITVISDEIHCDITAPGTEYVPFASVSEECRNVSVTCIAPTKAFNLAGLQTAAVYVPDPVLRHKIWRAVNTDEVAEPNALAVPAAVAAFTKGEAWLDGMRSYVFANRKYVTETLRKEFPKARVIDGDATYLLWIDCGSLKGDSRRIADFIRKETGLFLSAGTQYGTGGEHFLRMNIACPRKLCEDGTGRLIKGLKAYDALSD